MKDLIINLIKPKRAELGDSLDEVCGYDVEKAFYSFMELHKDEEKAEFKEYMAASYYSKNDDQHQINHISDLTRNMDRVLPKWFNNMAVEDAVTFMVAIWWHDSLSWKDRSQHHKLGADLIMAINNDRYLGVVPKSIRAKAAEMVLHHRASEKYDGDDKFIIAFRHIDKGRPNLYRIVARMGITGNDIWSHVKAGNHDFVAKQLEHLLDKYGPEGYSYAKDPHLAITYGDVLK